MLQNHNLMLSKARRARHEKLLTTCVGGEDHGSGGFPVRAEDLLSDDIKARGLSISRQCSELLKDRERKVFELRDAGEKPGLRAPEA